LPTDLESLGIGALDGCQGVPDIIISDAGTCLLQYSNNNEETEYTIPENIIEIVDSAFKYCENIETVVIPDNVEKIRCGVFSHCVNIKQIVLPNGLNANGLQFEDINNVPKQ
jgi:hypothetical protein